MRASALFILAIVAAAATAAAASPPRAGALPAGAGAGGARPGPAVAACAAAPVTGSATFFAGAYHGQTMANGRPFDMNDATVTAANRWPLGTRLRVRRIPGGPWDGTLSRADYEDYFSRAIVVTVQDRGAFTHELDLSRGAFRLLGRPREGRIRVLIEPLDCAQPPGSATPTLAAVPARAAQ